MLSGRQDATGVSAHVWKWEKIEGREERTALASSISCAEPFVDERDMRGGKVCDCSTKTPYYFSATATSV